MKFDMVWLKAAGIRAIKTVFQTALATLGTLTFAEEVNWKVVITSALIAGCLSMCTSAAGIPEATIVHGEKDEPEFEEIDDDGCDE